MRRSELRVEALRARGELVSVIISPSSYVRTSGLAFVDFFWGERPKSRASCRRGRRLVRFEPRGPFSQKFTDSATRSERSKARWSGDEGVLDARNVLVAARHTTRSVGEVMRGARHVLVGARHMVRSVYETPEGFSPGRGGTLARLIGARPSVRSSVEEEVVGMPAEPYQDAAVRCAHMLGYEASAWPPTPVLD